jgi:hypothetical protein
MSPLAIDIALSIVSLAALRAKAGVPPDDRERTAATELRDLFRRNLSVLRGSAEQRADAVTQDDMRRGLEETLASLTPISNRFHIKDQQLLETLIQLLDALVNGPISTEDASRLLNVLHQAERSLEERPAAPDLSAVGLLGQRDGR